MTIAMLQNGRDKKKVGLAGYAAQLVVLNGKECGTRGGEKKNEVRKKKVRVVRGV